MAAAGDPAHQLLAEEAAFVEIDGHRDQTGLLRNGRIAGVDPHQRLAGLDAKLLHLLF